MSAPSTPPVPKVVKLIVNGNNVVPDQPSPLRFKVNDHVNFVCDEGTIDIVIDAGSPNGFHSRNFHSGGAPLRAVTPGDFVIRCTVTIPGRPPLGWSNSNPGSGTEVIITNSDNMMP
ncbi:MAG: hypothetical protein ABI823_19715 [Bryobacteraceae bacterium]